MYAEHLKAAAEEWAAYRSAAGSNGQWQIALLGVPAPHDDQQQRIDITRQEHFQLGYGQKIDIVRC